MDLFALYGIWAIVLLVLALVWIVLPFAIIGTKPLLRQILEEQKAMRELVQDDFGRSDTHFLCPSCQEPVKNRATKCRWCLSPVQRPPEPPEPPKKRIRDFIMAPKDR